MLRNSFRSFLVTVQSCSLALVATTGSGRSRGSGSSSKRRSVVSADSASMISLPRSMHSSPMSTRGPKISLLTDEEVGLGERPLHVTAAEASTRYDGNVRRRRRRLHPRHIGALRRGRVTILGTPTPSTTVPDFPWSGPRHRGPPPDVGCRHAR